MMEEMIEGMMILMYKSISLLPHHSLNDGGYGRRRYGNDGRNDVLDVYIYIFSLIPQLRWWKEGGFECIYLYFFSHSTAEMMEGMGGDGMGTMEGMMFWMYVSISFL